eukprot:12946306-Ditylum_brightwellii.AAC.2
MQTSTKSVLVSCIVASCKVHAAMLKKGFNTLTKIQGFHIKLSVGGDYKMKAHYKEHHTDLLNSKNLPLLLESYIYYCYMLNKRSIAKSEMLMLKATKKKECER